MKRGRVMVGAVGVMLTAGAQDEAADAVTALDPVVVEARTLTERGDLPEMIFQHIPGVSLRKQGEGSPQADMSVRGAPFSSSGYLLGGVAIRNAQTEHWQFDAPLPAEWFFAPTLLTGLDRFRVSLGHPSGSVALELAPLMANGRRIAGGGGEKGLAFASAYAAGIGSPAWLTTRISTFRA